MTEERIEQAQTAGILIIGNELLTGKIDDVNARFLIRALRTAGVRLERVLFVRDDLEIIAREVGAMSAAYDHVFTSGGVGGTHDDITLPAVARAFELEVVEHPEMRALLHQYFGDELKESHLRMARLPAGSEVCSGPGVKVPVVRTRNVFVLPGTPEHLRAKLPAILPYLRGTEVWLGEIYLRVYEELVAEDLAEAEDLVDAVEVGSYPRFDEGVDHKVKITIDGPSEAEVARVQAFLLDRWSEGQVLRTTGPLRVGGASGEAG